MQQKFWNFKKYATSFSFCGFHFWAKPGSGVAAKCPACDWMILVEREVTPEMLDECITHSNVQHGTEYAHTATNKYK